MLISFIFLAFFMGPTPTEHQGHHSAPQTTSRERRASQTRRAETSPLTGVYRIDIAASEKLYSVVAGASSSVPFREQQRFFIDLAVRLTPPDLLAIEQQGTRISLGSSRAPRMTFIADGVTRNTRAQDGHVVRVRFSIENAAETNRLVFTSSGRTEDNFSVVFESIDNGKRLRVVRRIAAEALDQPLVIRTVYNKISDVAQWELYGESQVAASVASTSPAIQSLPQPQTRRSPSAVTISRHTDLGLDNRLKLPSRRRIAQGARRMDRRHQ